MLVQRATKVLALFPSSRPQPFVMGGFKSLFPFLPIGLVSFFFLLEIPFHMMTGPLLVLRLPRFPLLIS